MCHLNAVFRLNLVAAKVRTWKELVAFAVRKGWTEEQFRQALLDRDVSSATITNWSGGKKGTKRNLPPARYPLFADVIGNSTTVDELMGRSSIMRVTPPRPIPQGQATDPVFVLRRAQFMRLGPEQQVLVRQLIGAIEGAVQRAEEEYGALHPASKR